MIEKVSSNLGILINWKPEDFDLNIAHELIKKKKKFAWGTGGVTLKPGDEELPDGNILGLLKTSGQNNSLYEVTVDISEEFRDYLNGVFIFIRYIST